MDWKTAGAAFVMVFLAELGDKTQIALFTLTVQGKPRLAVLLGGALALVSTTILAVLAGGLLHRVLGEGAHRWIRIGAGAAFLAMGAFLLLGKGE
jgi:putative Ca2+/H+ antiporter (TMEM165/GDT1 family)